MGEFEELAKRFSQALQRLRSEGGVRAGQIPDLVSESFSALGSPVSINCYPGHPAVACHEYAVFVSIAEGKEGRGHLRLKRAFEKIVQHMQGTCHGKTRVAILLTDNWNPRTFQEWKGNLETISSNAAMEIYLVADRTVSAMYVS